MGDADFLMALKLQEKFNKEAQKIEDSDDEDIKVKNHKIDKWNHRRTNSDLDSTQNLVHPEWETLDPTPDVNALFQAFDSKFFQGRLKCVTLEWSKRMYSCAGICYSRKNHYGMAVTIRLSEPLLKLRSRKDLIETLLHEMIHAYCSVLGIREGNGGHGPNFKKIMYGINKVAGTNITVYHTFHDEVDLYKTHWWRCNGLCQHRKPFFGYVKRTSNRAPGPNDIWWRQHLQSCGGTFLKIREPDKKKPIKGGKENFNSKTNGKDIRKFFDSKNVNSKGKATTKSNGAGTIVINDNNNYKSLTSTPKKGENKPFAVNRVVGFKDLTGSQATTKGISSANKSFESSGGFSLNSPTNRKVPSSNLVESKPDINHIRNVWANRFPGSSTNRPNEGTSEENSAKRPNDNIIELDDIGSTNDEKRRKLDTEQGHISLDDGNDKWEAIDDEVMLKAVDDAVINISSDEEDEPEVQNILSTSQKSPEERQRQIKQEIMDSSDCDLSEGDIELIDDDYNDDLVTVGVELADTSLIDDLFGDDTLLKDFKRQNAVVPSNSRYHWDPKNDIISCPVCQDSVTREDFSEHLDGCVGISIKVSPAFVKPFYKRKNKKKSPRPPDSNTKDVLKRAGYNSNEIAELLDDSNEPKEESFNRRQGLDTSTHACPICGGEVPVDRINQHLDECLPDD